MPRSPSDATRFTSTGPYVSTKPSGSATNFAANPTTAPPFSAAVPNAANQINFGQAPQGETPQQKIARLRAAAAAAKRGKESTFDKSVRIGRVWADRAHRVTAYSLIGLTVVSAAVATAGITDMLLHNRRRRNEWLAEKKAESARELTVAKEAATKGAATEDQILLINRERAAEEAAEAKKNRPGMIKRASSWLFSGLQKEEQKGGRLGTTTAVAEAQNKSSEITWTGQGKGVLQAVEDKVDSHRRQGETVPELISPSGGPLDREAQVVANDVWKATRSWTSWVTGR
ncbi:hypothetical protein SEPMUDRAFT_164801 [Lecanosticta acicola]|uniref:Uncharacterized protein n=1 Tax=Lecanosticta acicola TaxID=111012 RepID=A0AAI9E7M7_9PEZI|nr:hypothetical protein SEPMUDRAFT_164801 [Lecanosticta acicola]